MKTISVSRRISRFLVRPARRPGWSLLLATLLVIVASVCAARLETVANMQTIFSASSPATQALNRIADEFYSIDELLILVTVSDDVADEDAPGRLESFAQDLESAIRSDDQMDAMCQTIVYRINDEHKRFVRDELMPAGLYFLDEASVGRVIERLTPEQMKQQFEQNEAMIASAGPDAGRVAKQLIKDPLRLQECVDDTFRQRWGLSKSRLTANGGLFLSKDNRSLLIRVNGSQPTANIAFTNRIVTSIESLLESVRPPDLTTELGGSYAVTAISAGAVRSDMTRSIFVSLIVLQLLFLAMYRRASSFAVAIVPVVYGVLIAFGVYSMVRLHLTPLTAVTGGLLAGLGVDYCIHFMSHFKAKRGEGLLPLQATEETIVDIGPSLIAACVTSLIGFLAITQSSVQSIRDFAIIGTIGLGSVLVATIIVLPCMLILADRVRPLHSSRSGSDNLRVNLAPLLSGITRHRRISFLGSSVVLVIALVLTFMGSDHLRTFETRLDIMHAEPNPALDAQRKIADRFTDMNLSITLYLRADTIDDLVELAGVTSDVLDSKQVKALGIGHTYGLANLVPSKGRVEQRQASLQGLNADGVMADFDQIVDESLFEPSVFDDYRAFLRSLVSDPAITTNTLRAYPRIAATVLPRAFTDATPEGESAFIPEAITTVYFDRPPRDRGTRREVLSTLETILSPHEGATLTGLIVIGHEIERAIQDDLTSLLAVAFVVVLVWLFICFRSVTDVVKCLFPIVFGLSALAAIMYLTGEQLNMVNLIAIPLLIGIGVDDGIFLVNIQRQGRAAKVDVDKMSSDLSSSCHAIIMTSVTTALAFGSLVFTSMPAIRSLGRIVSIGVIACLVGSLLFLVPVLISRYERGSSRYRGSNSSG